MTKNQPIFAIILSLSLIFITSPAQAMLFWGKKKNKTSKALHINEEILIKGKQSVHDLNTQLNDIIELQLAIHIPPQGDHITVTTIYDEVLDNNIDKIVWITEEPKRKSINPYKTENIVNKTLEGYSIDYNPSLAYDRITSNKHLVNKSFYFSKHEVLGDKLKARAHFLELHTIDGDSNSTKVRHIRIDPKIYQAPAAFEPIVVEKQQEEFYKPIRQIPAEDLAKTNKAMEDINKQQIQEMQDLDSAMQQLDANPNYPGNINQVTPDEMVRQQQLMQLEMLDGFGGEF